MRRLEVERMSGASVSVGVACSQRDVVGKPSRIDRGQYDPLPVVVGRKAGERAPILPGTPGSAGCFRRWGHARLVRRAGV